VAGIVFKCWDGSCVDRDGMLSIVDDALGILVIRVAGRCDELGWEVGCDHVGHVSCNC